MYGIGSEFPPFIVAELSGNHSGDIEAAKRSILGAKLAGASAVKLQTYTPDTMTLDVDRSEYLVKEGLWAGRKLYDLYKEAHTPIHWHKELFRFASEQDITIFSTPFDESAVDILEELTCPIYKIASFELQDIPLIEYVAKTEKLMIISTGMGSYEDIARALDAAQRGGSPRQILLHCISSYPAPLNACNLKQIVRLKKDFGVEIGLSDHTIGLAAACGAVALGAVLIEKHFKENDFSKGPDTSFSISLENLENLVSETMKVWEALGEEGYERPSIETPSKVFRRSLVFSKDIPMGTSIQHGDILRKRPGFGLPPYLIEKIIGRTLNQSVQFGQAVNWDLFDKE